MKIIDTSPDVIIERKALFIESLKRYGGNVRTALKNAELDKLTALTYAANDGAFRSAWEKITKKQVFS